MSGVSILQGADWPEYRGNPSRTGATEENLPDSTLGEAWVHASPQPPLPAWYGPAKWDAWRMMRDLSSMRNYDPVFHPIVVGDHVYFGSSADDSVYCLDLASGELVWRFTTDGPVRIAPTWVDGKLYFGSDDGYAYCIASEDGSLIWKFSPSPEKRSLINHGRFISFWPCRTGVTVAEDTAYFACSLLPWKKSYLVALDANTGLPEGEGRYVQVVDDGLTLEGAILVSPNLVICPQGRTTPRLFNRTDGSTRGSLSGGGGAFVVLVDESVVMHGPGNKRDWIRNSNPTTLEQIARYPSGNAIVISGDRSFMTTRDQVIASNWKEKEALWQVECTDPYELILAGDHIYLGLNNRVEAYDASNGEKVWSATVEGRAFGLAVGNGRLLVATDTGKIYCFRAGEGVQVASPAPEEDIVRRGDIPIQESVPEDGFSYGPWLEFDSPTTAVVRWGTPAPSPSIINYGPGLQRERIAREETPKTDHSLALSNLTNREIYTYTITTEVEGDATVSAAYECDSFFNYHRPPFPAAAGCYADQEQPAYAAAAEQLLANAPTRQGICVVLDSTTGRLGYEIARQSKMQVLCLHHDNASAEEARAALHEAGVYGRHVAVRVIDSDDDLKLPYHFANLIVSERCLNGQRASLDQAKIAHYLHPILGIGILAPLDESAEDQSEAIVVGEELPGTAPWTHMYGGPHNAGFSGETLGDVTSTDQLEVQWLGRPGPRYHADRQGRKNSPLSTGGRLFLQGLYRIVALDAYNGTVLWSLETPTLGRTNIPRNTSNWCADSDFLYAAIGKHCWQIDAATGAVVARRPLQVMPRDGWQYEWGYIARVDDAEQNQILLGSAVIKGAAVTTWWGRNSWHDGGGDNAENVCSDAIFAVDLATDELKWQRANGLVINSTLTADDGKVYFLECRNRGRRGSSDRRVAAELLWRDLYLVCLDQQTGELCWERSTEGIEPGRVMVSLASSEGRLVLVCNNVVRGQGCLYECHCFLADTGEPCWDEPAIPGWRSTDHGKTLSRPVIVGNRLLVRPGVVDMETGQLLEHQMPSGGCGTYVCSSNVAFFRAGSGKIITMWNIDTQETTNLTRLRPDCWLSTIPAQGMLLSPEGGGGCSCGRWLETSVGFIPVPFDAPSSGAP